MYLQFALDFLYPSGNRWEKNQCSHFDRSSRWFTFAEPLAAARIPPAARESSFPQNAPRRKRSPSHLPPNVGEAIWESSPLGFLVHIRSHYREMCHDSVVRIAQVTLSCNVKPNQNREIQGREAHKLTLMQQDCSEVL